MPSLSKLEQALKNFTRAIAAGRMPHAVLVAGHPRGSGAVFAERLLAQLFNEQEPPRLRRHVDIQWIEPESKARQIRVEEQIRPLIEFMGLTSYEGGWKAGVILFADRLSSGAQNALLTTLEEPPPRCLLLLVTDSPDALLATTRSRAQYVDVMEDEAVRDLPWRPVVLELLRHPPARRACELIAWTDRLTAPLRSLEELATAEETAREQELARAQGDGEAELTKAARGIVEGRVAARVKEMREEILRAIQLWQRDVLARALNAEAVPENFPEEAEVIAAQAQGLAFADAAARVAVVDEVRELLEHNIREAAALPRMARAFSAPLPA